MSRNRIEDGMSDDSDYDPTRDYEPPWNPAHTYQPSVKADTWADRDDFKNRSIDVMTAVILWALVLAVVIVLVGGAIKLTLFLFF